MVEIFRSTAPLYPPKLSDDEIHSAIKSVFKRRILTSVERISRLSPRLAHNLAYTYKTDQNHCAVMIHPSDETRVYQSLCKNYGSPFPLLYTINGNSVDKITKPGGIKLDFEAPRVFIGASNFNSKILTNGWVDIKSDGRLFVQRFTIKSADNIRLRVDYRIYLFFIMAYGDKIKSFMLEDCLDDLVASCMAMELPDGWQHS